MEFQESLTEALQSRTRVRDPCFEQHVSARAFLVLGGLGWAPGHIGIISRTVATVHE